MSTLGSTNWEQKERRKPNSNRRNAERRSYRERRHDRRIVERSHGRNLYGWLRSLVKLRLGVDRRKGVDRRRVVNDRRLSPGPLVTKDELDLLLK